MTQVWQGSENIESEIFNLRIIFFFFFFSDTYLVSGQDAHLVIRKAGNTTKGVV